MNACSILVLNWQKRRSTFIISYLFIPASTFQKCIKNHTLNQTIHHTYQQKIKHTYINGFNRVIDITRVGTFININLISNRCSINSHIHTITLHYCYKLV